ncbi:MAG: hypothetical protein WDM89_04450 [Rhizomicrobium sp.]
MNPTKGLPAWGAAVIVVLTLLLAWWLIPHGTKDAQVADQFPNDNFPSTYKPLPSRTTLIRGATILTATDKEIAHGDVLMADGKIKEVGQNIARTRRRRRDRRQGQVRHAPASSTSTRILASIPRHPTRPRRTATKRPSLSPPKCAARIPSGRRTPASRARSPVA